MGCLSVMSFSVCSLTKAKLGDFVIHLSNFTRLSHVFPSLIPLLQQISAIFSHTNVARWSEYLLQETSHCVFQYVLWHVSKFLFSCKIQLQNS